MDPESGRLGRVDGVSGIDGDEAAARLKGRGLSHGTPVPELSAEADFLSDLQGGVGNESHLIVFEEQDDGAAKFEATDRIAGIDFESGIDETREGVAFGGQVRFEIVVDDGDSSDTCRADLYDGDALTVARLDKRRDAFIGGEEVVDESVAQAIDG